METLSGDVKEEWLKRIKIEAKSTVLEQKEAADLHAFQLAEGWVASKSPKEMVSEVAGPLYRIHYQICQRGHTARGQQRRKKHNVVK